MCTFWSRGLTRKIQCSWKLFTFYAARVYWQHKRLYCVLYFCIYCIQVVFTAISRYFICRMTFSLLTYGWSVYGKNLFWSYKVFIDYPIKWIFHCKFSFQALTYSTSDSRSNKLLHKLNLEHFPDFHTNFITVIQLVNYSQI